MKAIAAAALMLAAAIEPADGTQWLEALPREFVDSSDCWHALQAPMESVPVRLQLVSEAVRDLERVSVRQLSAERAQRLGGPSRCATLPCYLVRAVEYGSKDGGWEADYCTI